MSTLSLVVVTSFAGHPVGTVITDAGTIASILASEEANNVVRVIGGTAPFLTAPIVFGATAGGTSTIEGEFWNFLPTGLAYSIDGTTPIMASSPTIAAGMYAFSIPTPTAGAHTISVQSTGPMIVASAASAFTTFPLTLGTGHVNETLIFSDGTTGLFSDGTAIVFSS